MSAKIGTLEYWQEVAEAVTDDARKLRAELAALRAERAARHRERGDRLKRAALGER